MSDIRCPHCGEIGRVSATLDPAAQLRCPWCGELTAASDVLAQLPPEFEVVVPDSLPEETAAFPQFAALAKARQGIGDHQPEDKTREAEAEETAADDTIRQLDFSASTEHPSYPRAGYGSRPTKSHRGWEFAKIVAGALLAIPAATLILLWLPGKWQRDPLRVGAKIGEVAPWLVPENLRPGKEQAQTEPADAQGQGGESELPPLPSMPEDTTSAPGGPRTLETPSPTATKSRKLPAEPNGSDRGESTTSAPVNDVKPSSSDLPQLPVEVVESPQPSEPLSPEDAVGVYDAPVFDIEDFNEALAAAQASWEAWTNLAADPQIRDDARAQIETQLLATLDELGQRAVFVRPDHPEIPALAKQTAELLGSIADDGAALARIGNHAAKRLQLGERQSDGIIVYGTVSRVRPNGKLFETHLDLAARNKTRVLVLSIADPRKLYRKGDRIIVLGSIVDQPALRVAGYSGDAERIVMGGLPYVLGRKPNGP